MKLLRFATACLCAAFTPLHALSEADAEAGRALTKRYADTVVGIELVVTVKISMGDRAMQPRESKIDTNGTVIAANGLTVTSLALIDPRAQFEGMRANMGSNRMEIGETDYKEVKLRLADGTEVPARVVLKDADLDLAFIAPDLSSEENAKREFAAVDLEKSAEGTLLEYFYFVSRAPKFLQRVPMVTPSLVRGIVERPRRFYLLSDASGLAGCPVFAKDGQILGFTVQYLSNGRPSGLVILPSADVAEIARQAAAVKVNTPPAASPTPLPTEPPSTTVPAPTTP
jgi:hypothetical protein